MQIKRGRLEMLVVDDTTLCGVRLEEGRLKQPAQVRHRRNGSGRASLLTIDALKHGRARHLIKLRDGNRHIREGSPDRLHLCDLYNARLKDGHDHGEHQRVACDADARLHIPRHS